MSKFSDKTPPAQTMQFKFYCTSCRTNVEQGSSADMIFALQPEYQDSPHLITVQHEACTPCSKKLRAASEIYQNLLAEQDKNMPLPHKVQEQADRNAEVRARQAAQRAGAAPPVVTAPTQSHDPLMTMLELIMARLTKLEETPAEKPKRARTPRK